MCSSDLSVRDSLSLLDQAIAHAAGQVKADAVRQMLGLADRTRVIDLFESLARGDIASAFKSSATNTMSAPIPSSCSRTSPSSSISSPV